MYSAAGAGRAELECSVLEEDWQTGQRYTAHWHSLTLVVPQDQHGSTVTEAECSGKHWEARRLLQRFLSGAISKNNTHPTTHPTRRPHQPTSDPSAPGPRVQPGPGHIQKEACCAAVRPKNIVFEKSERKTVVKMAKLPRFLG